MAQGNPPKPVSDVSSLNSAAVLSGAAFLFAGTQRLQLLSEPASPPQAVPAPVPLLAPAMPPAAVEQPAPARLPDRALVAFWPRALRP